MANSSDSIGAGHIPALTTADTSSTSNAPAGPSLLHLSSHSTSNSNKDSASRTTTQINNRKRLTSSSRQPNTQIDSEKSSDEEHKTVLHAHRQDHNSSKLPAFRFADRKKDALVVPALLPKHDLPSPVARTPARTNPGRRSAESTKDPDQTHPLESHQHHQQQDCLQVPEPPRDLQDAQSGQSSPQQPRPPNQSRHIPASSPARKVQNENEAINTKPSTPLSDPTQYLSPSRIRASTFQTASPTKPSVSAPSSSTKRPASFPVPTVVANLSGATTVTSESQQHSTITSPESYRTTASKRPHNQRAASVGTTKDWAQGQRELLLPKTIDTTKSDEKRRSRPPISFRPPNIAAAAAAATSRPVIPPIRSFRSSGSRKSLGLDMDSRRASLESSDGSDNPNYRDQTLRALEGRSDDEYSQMSPPPSAYATPAEENTADIFMRIASEEPAPAPAQSPRGRDGNGTSEEHSSLTLTRLRSSQRRPFSATVPSHQVSSPPQVTRRLSDQRETSRTRRLTNEQPAQQLTRELNYRTMTKDHAPPVSAQIQSGRMSSLRPSPITPRTTMSFQDSQSEVGVGYSRRRTSVTDNSGGLPSTSRASHLRSANLPCGNGRTYNSSPLVQRSMDISSHHHQDPNYGESTESSTASTAAAPSMIWDELDDLKSRIHRLELTGKPPATSAQAMSRVSDERPATAVTNATTMSASPKRNPRQVDEVSTTSSQRESQPILLSALSKTKGFVSSDVFTAIESAANDALALTSMMGAPGQPGPISSGVSTIGGGGGGNVTDRQLRKKAESICRSLTELCLALTDEAPIKPMVVTMSSPREKENLVSPTTSRSTNITSQRRPSALTDHAVARLNPAPRAPSALEQRRNTLFTTPVLSSPRFAQAPGSAPIDSAGTGRKSSLLISRTRRAGTEEPEEQSGRKSSLLLRTRRAGTEEPEEQAGRKTSLLRARRGTINDDNEEIRFRAPSRATTEVNHLRNLPRDYTSQQQDFASSALPRRRLAAPGINSRLLPPSSSTVSTPPASATGRRFLERHTPDRESSNVTEKLAEDRAQRLNSLSHTAMLNRTSSLSRRRDSAIPGISLSASHVGTYR